MHLVSLPFLRNSIFLGLVLLVCCVRGNELNNMSIKFTDFLFTRYGELSDGITQTAFRNYVDNLQLLGKSLSELKSSNCSMSNIVSDTFLELCNNTEQCNLTGQLLKLVLGNSSHGNVSEGSIIQVKDFQSLCPVLLHQLEFGSCSMESAPSTKPTPLEVWGYGFLFVTVINLSSIFGAVLLPLMDRKFFSLLLVTLVGLAVGSLSGSAMFHLIPQAYGLLDSGNHDYLFISLLVLCGIYFFFMVERFLKIFIDYNKHKHDSKHEHTIDFKPGQDSAIATVAWMIVFGDGLHNFIDGLSIGAAFNESILTGISISVAVICEELPHELGDLAVLLNSGMSIKQALLYNFLSALTCYGGLIAGTLLGELAAASMYIFAIAGGVFLYISLVDMIPEMNQVVEEASKDGVWEAIKVILLQNVGWISGTSILFTLAYFADRMVLE